MVTGVDRAGWVVPRATMDPPSGRRNALYGELTACPGQSRPLGPSAAAGGVNFAVRAPHAAHVRLCLHEPETDRVLREFEMVRHADGETWTLQVRSLPPAGALYSYRVAGRGAREEGFRWAPDKHLLDPYAPLVEGRREWGVRDATEHFRGAAGSTWRGTYDFEADFDWGRDYRRPNLPFQDLIVYECSVRLMTASPTSGVAADRRGTFLGLADKVPYLKALGVTAVELLPVFEFDELELQREPNPRDHMVNTWGYATTNFFAPMKRLGTRGSTAAETARQFKEMVKRFHDAGIEVILDVVYNHTAEGGDFDKNIYSFRGIDNPAYYMLGPKDKHLMNYSGCGNTVNANGALAKDLIVDSLRHWVEEYHVDGFRFDLASAMCRDHDGTPLPAPPVIRAIAKDPVLLAHGTKLISEPWDCGGLYQVGSFPHWDVWAEWNGRYRDDVRGFIKGDEDKKGAFATRLAGSADLYHHLNRKPYHSINFIIAHDGFTLRDLVSYNGKHNDLNGEGNRDGSNDNLSWNCGAEGEHAPPGVEQLRRRQMRNFHLALVLSQGTPMVLMGDEYGRSTSGNNNTYGHDHELTWFNWDIAREAMAEDADGFFQFYSQALKFRARHPLLGRAEFLKPEDITWHETQWDNPESKFLSFTLHDRGQGGGDLCAAFNAHDYAVEYALPAPPPGKAWHRVADTNLYSPKDFNPDAIRRIEGAVYSVTPYSSILLVAK